ncbi:cysteine protease ATG4A-like isoform X2 [Clavelina lepadiformis]|uniref:cysteine protease ATG4A-like isoform X2 n=1 Tax=Clavelina lepadiformis TaxID=159417 RepID=UPI0040437B9F
MAFAYGYFNNIPRGDMERDTSMACLTYENMVLREEMWRNKETVTVLGQKFKLPVEREKFLHFVRSKIWCTYRKGFSPIGGTGPTSDTGWGCMLRCGQMMLAQALSVLSLTEDWQWSPSLDKQPAPYRRILTQLSDIRTSCYSIHQIAQMGVPEGKEVGQWFGPNTIAQVLRKLSQFDQEHVLAFHVAMDNTVSIEDIEKVCSQPIKSPASGQSACSSRTNSTSELRQSSSCSTTPHVVHSEKINTFWKPLFLIIPLRLGLSDINPVYFKHLKEILQWEESVGVIGGKPNHAYYFVGCSCNDSLVYLDPHTTQLYIKFPDVDSKDLFDDATYHCDCPGRMLVSQLDPSLALGFVCSTRQQFESFCNRIKTFKKSPTSLPLFEVVNAFPKCNLKESQVVTLKSHNRQKKKQVKSEGKFQEDDVCIALDSDESLNSDEDFEILDFD